MKKLDVKKLEFPVKITIRGNSNVGSVLNAIKDSGVEDLCKSIGFTMPPSDIPSNEKVRIGLYRRALDICQIPVKVKFEISVESIGISSVRDWIDIGICLARIYTMFEMVMGWGEITTTQDNAFHRLQQVLLISESPVITMKTSLTSEYHSCNGTVIDVVGRKEMNAYWNDMAPYDVKNLIIDPLPDMLITEK